MWAIQRLSDSLYFPIITSSPPPPDIEWVSDVQHALPFFSKNDADAFRKLYLETLDEEGNVPDPMSTTAEFQPPPPEDPPMGMRSDSNE